MRVTDEVAVKRVVFSRRLIEFHGIDTLARLAYRAAMQVLRSWPGRITVVTTVVAGIASLSLGRPAGPAISHRTWVDFAIGLVLGYALAASQ
ncbi:hypothetical protein MYIN104542_21270 [Mycobacterium intermedium]